MIAQTHNTDVVKMVPPKKLTKKDPTVPVDIQSLDVVKMDSPEKLMLKDQTVSKLVLHTQNSVVPMELP